MKKSYLYLLLLLALASCGYREGIISSEPAAFLSFGGNTTGAVVNVDDNVSFSLGNGPGTAAIYDTGEKEKRLAETHYRVTPGKHRIQVVKNGTTVVDRELLIGDGITKEIAVP